VDDFVRAASGAFVFAVPLLYTMEMWWIGTTADLWTLLLFLGVAFLIAFGLARSHTGGFKQETGLAAGLEQAVDVVAVGLVAAVVVLVVLNRISPAEPVDSILGKLELWSRGTWPGHSGRCLPTRRARKTADITDAPALALGGVVPHRGN